MRKGYYTIPAWLLDSAVSQEAKMVYMYLYSAEGVKDEFGKIYKNCKREDIADALSFEKHNVYRYIRELKEADLIRIDQKKVNETARTYLRELTGDDLLVEGQKALSDVPPGYRLAKEARSKQVAVLMQPSLHKQLVSIAKASNVSVNELINVAIQKYVEESAKKIVWVERKKQKDKK